MTPRTSAQIAVEIAETLSRETGFLARSGEGPHRVTVAVRGLVTDYERARAREATAEPEPTDPRAWVFAPVHACEICEAGRCPACDGDCKVPARCADCGVSMRRAIYG